MGTLCVKLIENAKSDYVGQLLLFQNNASFVSGYATGSNLKASIVLCSIDFSSRLSLIQIPVADSHERIWWKEESNPGFDKVVILPITRLHQTPR